MGKEEANDNAAAERKAKSILKQLKDLDPELLEDISIGAETELANRETADKGAITHISELEEAIDEAAKTWGKVSGLSTGYPKLDAMLGGLRPGEITLIAGDPGNGKSALAQNIAVNVAKQTGVLFITLEMLKTEAGSRMRFMNNGSIKDLDLMFQTEYQIDYRHLEALFQSGIEVGVKLVILDYLQYLGRGMTNDEVAKMSKLMKSLALQYQVPFVIIVSLRKGEAGKFKRKWMDVELEDLMGTSAIGYDTDIAMVASRRNLENEFETDKFFVKVLKTRNMALDYNNRFLEFKWDKTRIEEIADYDWIPKGIPASSDDAKEEAT